MENIIENVAKYLNRDPVSIRKLNMYKKGDTANNGDVNFFHLFCLLNY
jgi:xanthine dehydrogenase molybdopterin-binding subunit B